MPNKQASPSLISGRELRRARNVVKKWQRSLKPGHGQSIEDCKILGEVSCKRYERACALILADKLRKS